MDDIVDYSTELQRRKGEISERKLLHCVTVDVLGDERVNTVFAELNIESCFDRNWRKLAGKLLKPPPLFVDIEELSKSKDPARELLVRWVSQSGETNKTFEWLIATMIECKLYSACDELLDFLEDYEIDVVSQANAQTSAESSNVENHSTTQSTLAVVERQQPNEHTVVDRSRQGILARSQSCPAGWLFNLRRRFRQLFRLNSSPARLTRNDPRESTIVQSLPTPLPPEENEIFVVCSDEDNRGQPMRDLISFIRKLQPVARGMLTVKTIHDFDQNGMITTTWLQQRVDRAKFVIVCFTSLLKAIADASCDDETQFSNQTDINIKFTMNFLVTGKIYESGCRNPRGKFIPVLLEGHDISTVIIPLRYFKSFDWPDQKTSISNYIMNRPEYPLPRQRTPLRVTCRPIVDSCA